MTKQIEAMNVASQCRATASSPLARNILVDDGSGFLSELLLDAARAIETLAEQPAPAQEPAVAAYWAVVDWDGKHIQVDQDTMQLEVYETKHHAKANVNSRTKAMLVYISATPPAPAQPLTDKRVKVKLGSWYGEDLSGHWFYLHPADNFAEEALTKHTGISK
jgi:hypothetical protein